MLGNKATLTVAELIEVLKEMPQDFKVYSWEGDKRIPISDVVNVGDVVDLYWVTTEWRSGDSDEDNV
jgi:hypothetical protein